MKVLFLLTSLGAGGTEASTAALVPELQRRGISCEIAVLERTTIGYEESVRAAGTTVHHVAGGRLWTRIRAFRDLVKSSQPDVIHTAIFEADIIGRVAAARSGISVVSSLVNTSYDPVRLADANVAAAKLRTVQLADGLTARYLTTRLHAVSDGVALANAQHLRLPMHKIEVIERGRDPESLMPSSSAAGQHVRREFGASERSPFLLAVGRVEFQKGHVDLIRAIAPLVHRDPTALLVIAGREGNASPDVERLIRELGLEASIRLAGHRTDIADLLDAADVFVLPSLYEGTAGAAIEAMAAGTPIVASDLAGLRGVLENESNALLVESGSPLALDTTIRRVLSDAALSSRLADQARKDFLSRFTISLAADRMTEFYLALAAQDQPSGSIS